MPSKKTAAQKGPKICERCGAASHYTVGCTRPHAEDFWRACGSKPERCNKEDAWRVEHAKQISKCRYCQSQDHTPSDCPWNPEDEKDKQAGECSAQGETAQGVAERKGAIQHEIVERALAQGEARLVEVAAVIRSGPWQENLPVGQSTTSRILPSPASITAPQRQSAWSSNNRSAVQTLFTANNQHATTPQSLAAGQARPANAAVSQVTDGPLEPIEQLPKRSEVEPYEAEIYTGGFRRLQSPADPVTEDNAAAKPPNLLSSCAKGVRTEFGKGPYDARSTTVLANYFVIDGMPKVIYEYQIKLPKVPVKKRDDKDPETNSPEKPDQEFREIKQREEKRLIFDQLRHKDPLALYCDFWASDYDRLWSVRKLFKHDDQGDSPSLDFTVTYTPLGGKSITLYPVCVSFSPPALSTQSLCKFVERMETAANHSPVITALNALLSKYASASTNLVRLGANKFFLKKGYSEMLIDVPHRPGGRSGGLQAHRGYFLSVRPGMGKVLVNINTVTSAFFKPILLSKFIMEYFNIHDDANMQSLTEAQRVELRKILMRIKVVRTYKRQVRDNPHINSTHNRTARISGVGKPVQVERILSLGKTVQEYFASAETTADIRPPIITRPMLPAINLAVPKRAKDSPVWVPAELLDIDIYQGLRAQLDPKQMAAMIKVALHLPAHNAYLIANEGLRTIGVGVDAANLDKLDLRIDNKLLEVPARFLKPPTIKYALNQMRVPNSDKGDWNLKGNIKFVRPARGKSVTILNLRIGGDSHPATSLFRNTLRQTLYAHDLGVLGDTAEGSVRAYDAQSPDDFEHDLRVAFGQTIIAQADLVIAVLPVYGVHSHAVIRRVADMYYGKRTVCCRGEKLEEIERRPDSDNQMSMYAANLAMKINLKSGGSNHYLLAEETHLLKSNNTVDTIIVGADVTHPGGSIPGCPSIASVVATADDDFVKYCGSMRLQLSRQEIIDSLKDMLVERLIEWSDKHGGLPKRVLFYRDGVSEGQYEDVRNREIPQIFEAYRAAGDKLKMKTVLDPKITFVVVGKRHHTRFFPQREEDMIPTFIDRAGKRRVNGNVKAGLVVDQIITHPHDNDFYLQSHGAIAGQGRSAHYYVLRNEMNLDATQLQRLVCSLTLCKIRHD